MPAEPARRCNAMLFAERILPNKRVTAAVRFSSAYERSKETYWPEDPLERRRSREISERRVISEKKKRRKNRANGKPQEGNLPGKLREVSHQPIFLDVAISRA